MRIKYNRDQKIKGNLTRNFDKDYAFLEKALDRSGDIVKNVFCVGDTADIQSIMEEQTDANTDSDANSIMERTNRMRIQNSEHKQCYEGANRCKYGQ